MKRSFAVAVLTLLLPGVAHAQGDPRLVGLLPSLLGGDAASDFNQAIVSQLSTLPLGSSAGGFTFTFDPNTQTFTRNSDSFGPSLAERATTMGENTFNVGAMYQRATYDSVAGRDLNNGEIRFFVPDIPAPGDVVSAELAINIETDVVVWYMTYGLTDRLDVGTAVPIVRVGLDATVTPTLVQRGDGSLPPGQGIPLPVQSASGSATGLGDIVLHTKYNFLKRPGGGAAAVLDVRLPTGDSDNLLGTGSASGKLLFVASTTLGRVAPHFNGGYTFVGDGANPEIETDDEYNYVAGIEAVVTDRVTVAVDFIARTLTNVGRLRLGAAPPPTPESNAPGNQLNRQEGDLHLRHGAVGLKWNAGRTWLLTTNVMFPLNDAGLVDNLAISEFPKWRKYLILLSFLDNSSARPVQIGGVDVNICHSRSTAVRGRRRSSSQSPPRGPFCRTRTGPVEADRAVDAQNAPTAPWKTLCVFHELPQGLSHQVTHEKLRKAPKYRWETRIDPITSPGRLVSTGRGERYSPYRT